MLAAWLLCGPGLVPPCLAHHGEITPPVRQAPQAAPPAGTAAAAVNPAEVLRDTAARQLVATLRSAATDSSLILPLNLAAEGAWDRVEASLGAATAGESAAVQTLRGLALISRSRFDEAAACLRSVLEQNPNASLVAYFLGWAEAGLGHGSAAIDAWRRAAEIDPALVPAYLALADAYLRQSQPALAAGALRAGLTAVPRSPELLRKLAEIERR